MTSAAKIAFSLEPELLRALDEAARRRRVSRSRLIREAIKRSLDEERTARLREKINEVFADEATSREQVETAEALLSVTSATSGEADW